MRECPKCKKPMRNLGNVSGVIYLSYPEQWDETYVCDDCKIKDFVRVHGEIYDPTGGRDLDTYTQAQDYRDWRTEQGMADCYFKESLFKK